MKVDSKSYYFVILGLKYQVIIKEPTNGNY